ncbi:MAG: hypothetical protein QNJ41_11630 [Xenococcaceae cyanobacterium MO_188.B32]|nr:hypothetical protein [Xenococcaceae cyanobacterium MO_188.B32]
MIATSKRIFNSFASKPWLILLTFSVLGLIGILNHAMWRDEVNTWLIVRDSQSLSEVISNINYQGHPLLWGLLVTLLKNIVNDPIVMQLFHLVVGVAAVAIFLWFSPFSKTQKLLFTFGYLPFYEYLSIARNYSLGMLFLFGFCAFFKSRYHSYILLAILMSLMANSNAYALFISFALAIMLVAEFIFAREFRVHYLKNAKNYDLAISLAILIGGFLLSIYIISPPPDSTNHGGVDAWLFDFDLLRLLRSIGRLFAGYILIVPHGARWLDLSVCAVIAILVFLLNSASFLKKPFALLFYVLGTMEILAFTYFRFLGLGQRHYGQFFLILIASIWLANQFPTRQIFVGITRIPKQKWQQIYKSRNIALMIILWVQFLAGILYAYPRDLIIPFSAGRDTSHYIKENNLEREFIVASRDANMAPISAYLQRKLYYPELKRMASFTLFRAERQELEHSEILAHIESELLSDRERILLILHRKLKAENNNLKIEEIARFENSWTDTERYYLYWVRR